MQYKVLNCFCQSCKIVLDADYEISDEKAAAEFFVGEKSKLEKFLWTADTTPWEEEGGDKRFSLFITLSQFCFRRPL